MLMNKNDYDKQLEDTSSSKYFYEFDKNVVNPYIVKTIYSIVDNSEILEIGAATGNLTKILLKHFDNVTAIEPSKTGFIELNKINSKKLSLFNSTIEEFTSVKKFKSVILSHVLEHLDDRVDKLRIIYNNLLEEGGKLIVVVPNANALSRQIAVAMGLIDHITEVTKDEKIHGHFITYTLESLTKEIKDAGFRISLTTGVMIKQLANFQWDSLIKNEIVNMEYFDGAYQVGLKYPDLCSSILVVCEKK